MNANSALRPSLNPQMHLAGGFIAGVHWPIGRASLVALADLGLTPQQIARYFSVIPTEVSRLLELPLEPRTTPLSVGCEVASYRGHK